MHPKIATIDNTVQVGQMTSVKLMDIYASVARRVIVCKDMAMGLNMRMCRMMILVIRGFVGRGGMLLLIIVGKFLGFV